MQAGTISSWKNSSTKPRQNYNPLKDKRNRRSLRIIVKKKNFFTIKIKSKSFPNKMQPSLKHCPKSLSNMSKLPRKFKTIESYLATMDRPSPLASSKRN